MLALQQQGVESSRMSRQQGVGQQGVRRWEEKKNRQKQSRGDLSLQAGPVFRPTSADCGSYERRRENT
jgi:hypothetical protein